MWKYAGGWRTSVDRRGRIDDICVYTRADRRHVWIYADGWTIYVDIRGRMDGMCGYIAVCGEQIVIFHCLRRGRSKLRKQGGGPGSTTGFAWLQALLLLAVHSGGRCRHRRPPLGLPPGSPPSKRSWAAVGRRRAKRAGGKFTLLARRKGKILKEIDTAGRRPGVGSDVGVAARRPRRDPQALILLGIWNRARRSGPQALILLGPRSGRRRRPPPCSRNWRRPQHRGARGTGGPPCGVGRVYKSSLKDLFGNHT